MTTVALPQSLHLPEDRTFQVPLLPSTTSEGAFFGGPTDLHFTEGVFSLEAEQEVHDLLFELGIIPTDGDASPGVGEEDGPNSTIFTNDLHRSVSPTSSDAEVDPQAIQLLRPPPSSTRSVTLDKTGFFSVPNPILKDMAPQLQKTEVAEVGSAKQGLKRKLSNVSADKDLTEEGLEERRQRNRNHAKKSRLRKKAMTVQLQESVEDLRRENEKLRAEINAIIGHKKAEKIMAERSDRNRANFLAKLMDPRNRVLDDSGLSFMKNLRKNLPNKKP